MGVNRKSIGYAAIALGIVLFVAVNIVSNTFLRGARIDLTEGGLYTVSEGTRATLGRLQEPVTLRLYFSRDAATGYPTVTAYAARVRDLLNEYEALGNGRIVFQEIDPVSFTPAEDEAVAAGLTGAPTPQGETVYFGLSGTNTFGGREVIPFFDSDREEYLEYDITSLIDKLSTARKPKLGILSSLPLETGLGGVMAAIQGNAQPLAIYGTLRERFDVQTLQQTVDRIPEDVSVLLVAHPAGLTDRTIYAIDQFVLRGGRAIVMVDPVSELAGQAAQAMPGMGAGPAPSSDLPALFRAWGVQYDASKVVGDGELAQRVRFGAGGNQTMEYIVWLRLTADQLNNDDPVTADLNQVNLASVGALRPAQGATTRFAPLMTSSSTAALLEADQVRSTQNPADLLRGFQAAGGSFTIAARLSGPARTAFPQGAPPAPPPQPAAEGQPAPPAPQPLPAPIAQAQNINVIVVADTDLLDDRFWVEAQNLLGTRVFIPIAENGALVMNAVENMMGSSDLISLRTRAAPPRNFTVVDELRRQADVRFLEEEQRLQQQITATEAQLRSLEAQAAPQGGAAGAAAVDALTPEQQATIERFRRELVQSRASLRAVQATLRQDVESLGNLLAFLNIAVMPLLVAGVAITLALLRRRRRMRARGI
jgi:ABC-type uncharacterized transport system involved in gliding motility auxiliary subunit